ncbi:MAG: universal stress protein [Bacteroidales bacterium]|nr:universal stress protein [Bacteroidales bacterium]
MKQRTIIVGTDFSKGSYVALELAVDIANKIHADIQLMWICREKMLYTDDQNNYVRNLATQKMDDLCEKYQPQLNGTTITPIIMQGKVAPMLAAQAEKVKASMIVIGTNGASGFEKYWMGSTAVRIVQEATCPVLSIREGFNFHKSLERILVPLNMSTNSRQKLPVAVKMAKAFGSQINILGQYENTSQAQTVNIYIKQAETFLQKQNIQYTTEIMQSKSLADDVLSYADTISADLIVISTEQDQVLSSLFIGTTAQQLVHHSLIPILSVHPADINSVAR